MGINDEHRALLDRISHIGASLDEKQKLEERVKEEISSLRMEQMDVNRELRSLREIGILYCKSCNDLYQMSDTRIERKEASVEMTRDNGYGRKEITNPAVLRFYCPQCDTTLKSKLLGR